MKEKNIIVVEEEMISVVQKPIIKETLEKIGKEVDIKVEKALALECTTANKQEVKKARTSLTNQFDELEKQRKKVKNIIMTPYEEMNAIYNLEIADKFKNADLKLKAKIDEVEAVEKKILEDGVTKYFDEYATSNSIDFLKFEDSKIKVGISDNPTNLQKQAKAFLDKTNDDLKLIDTQEHKAEILVEYKQSLNISNAITSVVDRFKRIEVENQRLIDLEAKKQAEAQVVAKVEEVVIAPVVEEKVIESIKVEETEEFLNEIIENVPFKVTASRIKIRELREYMKKEGILYE